MSFCFWIVNSKLIDNVMAYYNDWLLTEYALIFELFITNLDGESILVNDWVRCSFVFYILCDERWISMLDLKGELGY